MNSRYSISILNNYLHAAVPSNEVTETLVGWVGGGVEGWRDGGLYHYVRTSDNSLTVNSVTISFVSADSPGQHFTNEILPPPSSLTHS